MSICKIGLHQFTKCIDLKKWKKLLQWKNGKRKMRLNNWNFSQKSSVPCCFADQESTKNNALFL